MFEYLVGLNVTDDNLYAAYRKAMTPILLACGGGFSYDFRVAETLTSQADHPVNRVFTIHFPDHEKAEQFFRDPQYMVARREYFEQGVDGVTIIAGYERPD